MQLFKKKKKQQFQFDRWNEFRANQAIDKIVGEGLAWIDEQSDEKSYWFPSLFPKRQQATTQSA